VPVTGGRLRDPLTSGDDADEELVRALSFLGWDVGTTELRRSVRSAAAVAAALVGAVAVGLTSSPRAGVGLAGVAALGVGVLGRRAPLALARLRRTRALGDLGALVGLVVLRMRIEPTVEAAVDFAAAAGDGALARSLQGHARRGRGSGRAGLDAFATEWAPWFPATERAAGLVAAAAATPADDREATLDRALTTVQRGTRDRLADFVDEIRGPVSGLYAFGVLLPLALVGLLPAARVAGFGLSVRAVALVYDLLLPAMLLGAGAWLLVRRPVAFPPPRVGRDHPDVPDRRLYALLAGAGGALAAWWVGGRAVASWAAPVAAVGFGVGTALLVVGYAPKRVRDRVRTVEAGLADALALVGRRVADGEALETALAGAGRELGGPVGRRLSAASRRMHRLGESPQRALCGPTGAFDGVPSRRVESAASMLALAATEGEPAGRALVSLADQFDALGAVEADARRELGRVTDTLTNTATAFGPLVAGATVALAARVAAEGSGPLGGGIPVGPLGLAVGGYVLVSAVVLTGLSTALTRGLDPALLTYRVGLALPTATATYLAAVVGAGLLVGA
jgi:Flp pilus assembly protein TadB